MTWCTNTQTITKYQCADGSVADTYAACSPRSCSTPSCSELSCPKSDCEACPTTIEESVKEVVEELVISPTQDFKGHTNELLPLRSEIDTEFRISPEEFNFERYKEYIQRSPLPNQLRTPS